MITITTYILHEDSFVKVDSNTDVGLIADRFYIEGAIRMWNGTEEILGLEQWDLVDQLWSYLLDGMEELLDGKGETSFSFPDQPLEMAFKMVKGNGLLIRVGTRKYIVDQKEFFSALLSAAEVFYGFLVQCDASALMQGDKVRLIKNKVLEFQE